MLGLRCQIMFYVDVVQGFILKKTDIGLQQALLFVFLVFTL